MGKRLLIVEDEVTLARALARLLGKTGYEVFLAGSCEEARRAPGTFSLGVFDVELPDGNGVDLAVELGKTSAVRRAVFFTGACHTPQRKRAALLGTLVDKAHGFHELATAIELSLSSRQALVIGAEESPNRTSDAPPSGVKQKA